MAKKEKPTTKICKHCKTEIPYDAKVCPQCRKKVKGGKLKWIIIILIAVVILVWLFGSGNNVSDGSEYDAANVVPREDYDKVFANTDDYMNKSFDMYGKIFNIMDSDNGTTFQMDLDEDADKFVVVYSAEEVSVKEDEYVLVKGVLTDTFEGENIVGGTVTCPLISAASIEESNYIDAFVPTISEYELDESWSVSGLEMTLDKVEFAETETRLYVTLENTGNDAASIYYYSSVLMQGSNQYEYEGNWEEENELPDEIKAGASCSGVIVFPAIEEKDFDFIFSGYAGDNWFDDESISVSLK